MLVQHLEADDAVDAVDGGEEVAGVFKAALVLEEGGQVKIILREHDAHRLDAPGDRLLAFQAGVLDLDHALVADGLAQRPEAAQNGLVVVGRDVVEGLVGDQLVHQLLVLGRHGALHQLVQNGQHLIPAQRAALQQNLADGQDLVVGQAPGVRLDQAVALAGVVVDHLLPQIVVGDEAAQRLHVPLDAPLRNVVLRAQLRLGQHVAAAEVCIDFQQTRGFGFGVRFHLTSLPVCFGGSIIAYGVDTD